MIDIPGIYVGRFKDNPNNRPALMTRAAAPTYTDDNWANVESTGTIWRYSSKLASGLIQALKKSWLKKLVVLKRSWPKVLFPGSFKGSMCTGKVCKLVRRERS